jgi:xanthine dehydrogenase accessory factor
MTHNHQMDFEILRSVLERRDAHYVGLIGSYTKWARFRHRFLHRGYDESFFRMVRCPVGLSNVPGKLPVEVAVSVAAEIIGASHEHRGDRQVRSGIPWTDLKQLSDGRMASDPDDAPAGSPDNSSNPA